MARFKKIQVMQAMAETKVIPVFYHADLATAKQVLKSCYEGGIRVFEFTNRNDFAHEVFSELEKWASKEYPQMILGIGSIVDAGTAALYLQLGANFIVSPLLNPDIFKVCNRRLVPYIPGCGSVSEIGVAQELGADIVKVFPAGNVGGPSFVKNLKAPMPWANVMVTGGVDTTRENLSTWIKAGADYVGIGSNLFPSDIIAAENWEYITDKCKEVLSYISENK